MMNRPAPLILLLGTVLLTACADSQQQTPPDPEAEGPDFTTPVASIPEGAQALSFLGDTLFAPDLPEEVRAQRQEELEEAIRDLEANPTDPDAIIWAGRRTAYLGEYRRAIEFFTLGIQAYPDDARFYRHRGHRYVTVRELDRAIADFSRAAELIQGRDDEVEPDGQPNALGIPTSTLHFNIWYHYGLAHYLKGEFDEAVEKYRACMEVSEHPDSKVATAHWLYMSLRRMDMVQEAQALIQGMDLDALAPEVIESGSYLDMLRLYAGADEAGDPLDPESLEGATHGYGLGNWHFYNGRQDRAREIFREIVDARDQWAAFGYIAAEADLARMGNR